MQGSARERRTPDLRTLYRISDEENVLRPLGGIFYERHREPWEDLLQPDCTRTPWDHDLPLECWHQILLRLGPCSLLTIARTCHHLCALARDDRVWLRHRDRVARAFQMPEGRWSMIGDPLWNVYRCHFLLPLDRTCFQGKACRLISLWAQDYVPLAFSWDLGGGFRPRLRAQVTADEESSVTLSFTDDFEPQMHAGSLTGGYYFLTSTTEPPSDWQRYHSIVRDSDCCGPRNVQPWIWLERVVPQ